jgi:hypothetical protein
MSTSPTVASVGLAESEPRGVPRWWPWSAWVVFFLLAHGFEATLALQGRELDAGGPFLMRFVGLFVMCQWMEAECRTSGQRYPLDIGLFLGVVGVILVPYYLWRNHRWRGLLKIGGVVAIWAATYVLAFGGAFIYRSLVGE